MSSCRLLINSHPENLRERSIWERKSQLVLKVLFPNPALSSVGRGATQFARENEFPFVESRDLVTDEAVKELENFRKFNTTIENLFSGKRV